MKRFLTLILAVVFAFGLTACGGSSNTEETTETETAAALHQVTGFVDSVGSGTLSLYTNSGSTLKFNIENADVSVDGDKIKVGDSATISYEGEIQGGDT